MDKLKQIEQAIEKADKEQSNLNHGVFDIGGFTSPKIRHLMNNLGAISTSYLEIGVHRGAVLLSTLSNNSLKAVAIDNFSEFDDGTVENELRANIKRFEGNVLLLKTDCWTADLWGKKFDLYLFDGAHDFVSQRQAMTYFQKQYADEMIVCVDDFDWDDVERGTMEGLMRGDYLIEKSFFLEGKDGWHNGFAVFLLKKPTV